MTTAITANESENCVALKGRLAAEPSVISLPSGDEICAFRIVVPRPKATAADGGRVTVDTIDCRAATPKVRQTICRADPGTELQILGQLRRRFWRSEGGVRSRYEVEVTRAVRVRPRRQSGA